MTLRFRDIALELHEEESLLPGRLASTLGLRREDVTDFRVVRRSIDARRKPRIQRVYTVEFESPRAQALLENFTGKGQLEELAETVPDVLPSAKVSCHVVVVGMGPAGLFCALRLAEAGARVTLVDMGRPVEERVRHVSSFWSDGALDPCSNVQFGEGGAGTFSDGKLSTRLKHPRIREILQRLVDFGADPDILVQAKPHVGSDRLRKVLIGFRRHLQGLGVDVRFGTRLSGFEISEGRVCGALFDDCDALAADALVLAPGHSATETFRMLQRSGVQLEAKPFAMGVRVEHPVELINRIQYGIPRHERLPAADYALAYNDPETGRGVYSFCMCPGGDVINASSEPGGVVVNGMSHRLRDGLRSNSALVVSVRVEDFARSSPLDGLEYQRHWEQRAFAAGGGGHQVPVQNLLSFLGQPAPITGAACPPGTSESELSRVLPGYVVDGIRKALPFFDRKMRGFVTAEATLYGVETRTSSPVRILRDERGESVSQPGLYPAGEGAGYAGGIMSAALDGMKAADAILEKHHRRDG